MTGLYIIVGAIALATIILVVLGLKQVQQSEAMVIERLGKYHRTLTAGINIIWPIIDRPRTIQSRFSYVDVDGSARTAWKESYTIDLREQILDFPPLSAITKDNVTTSINAVLYYQIIDPVRAVYEISNLPDAIEKLTQTTLRNVIGELEFDETLTSRDVVNAKLRDILDEVTGKWGVKVTRIEVQDITPPDSVKESMEKQMQAERDKRAAILQAQGEKEAAILRSEGEKASCINEAEAEKQTRILEAEGEARAKVAAAQAESDALRRIAQAIGGSSKVSPASYMLAQKYVEALQEIASSTGARTVFMPYEASSVLSSIGCIKDIFAEGGRNER